MEVRILHSHRHEHMHMYMYTDRQSISCTWRSLFAAYRFKSLYGVGIDLPSSFLSFVVVYIIYSYLLRCLPSVLATSITNHCLVKYDDLIIFSSKSELNAYFLQERTLSIVEMTNYLLFMINAFQVCIHTFQITFFMTTNCWLIASFIACHLLPTYLIYLIGEAFTLQKKVSSKSHVYVEHMSDADTWHLPAWHVWAPVTFHKSSNGFMPGCLEAMCYVCVCLLTWIGC